MSYLSIVRTTPEKTAPSEDFGCGWSVVPLLTALSLNEDRLIAEARASRARESRETETKWASVG